MKIIIVGALAKKRYFPSNLDDCEVWGLNAIYQDWIPRWDRRFNLHTYENLQRYKWRPEFFEREANFSEENPTVPFYTIDEWPDPYRLGWQSSQKDSLFPYERLINEQPRGKYHCGSFDWMVAFVVWIHSCWGYEFASQRPNEIAIHGVSLMMEAGEPLSARACLEYWCGFAEGQGIKITVAEDSALFDFYHLVRSDLCYGLDDTPVFEDRRSFSPNKDKAPYDYEE